MESELHGEVVSGQPKQEVTRSVTRIEFSSGPLPHPEILEHYERVLPGAAARIITMAEEQAKHRQALESQVIRFDVRNSRLGLYFGFAIGITGVAGGAIVALYGKTSAGTLISAASLVSLISVFILGSQQRRAELEDKRKEQSKD